MTAASYRIAQPASLDAAEFARLSADDAEDFVAARYCALTEAGYSPVSALAIATRTDIEVAVSTDVCRQPGGPMSNRAHPLAVGA
jgi:hypothetical protein